MKTTEQLAKEDFKVFLWLVWRFLGLPEPTPLQYDIADYLQNGEKRKCIEAFRGVGKSYITDAYAVWCLYRDPDENILVVSASKDRSDAFARFAKMLIKEMPLIQHLKPRYGHGYDSVDQFTVGPAKLTQFPSIKSVGLYGQMTGFRADRIIADDIEVPNNSETQVQREKLSERVKEFAAILKPKAPGVDPEITYLGTPQTEDSLYPKLLPRGYSIRIWPARYPQLDKVHLYKGEVAPAILNKLEADPSLAGQPTDTRFDDLDLIERAAEYGHTGFALQFMLDTSLSDALRYPLRCSDLIVHDVDVDVAPEKMVWAGSNEMVVEEIPCVGMTGDRFHRRVEIPNEKWTEYDATIMTIDPSGRGKDETGYCVAKILNSQIFIADCSGFTGGYDKETLVKLALVAKRWKVDRIQAEPNFGDGMFTELFKPILQETYPDCIVEEGPRATTQKELRIIHSLEPVMNQHRLIVDKSLMQRDAESSSEGDQNYHHRRLAYQLTRITKERGALVHDDRLDALAQAVKYFTAAMASDVGQIAKDKRDEALEAELEDWLENVTGTSSNPTEKTWLSDMMPMRR